MPNFCRFCCFLIVGLGLWSCEKEFIPDTSVEINDIVVEGYIEAGNEPSPPYVILTRSLSFFQEINQEQLENSFIHDAEVRVSDGEQSVLLTEVCLEELTPELRDQAASLFGFSADSIGFNFCAYIDLSFSMQGEEGKQYNLTIESEGKTLNASTTIPFFVPLDSLWFVEPPGEPTDTLAQLRCFVNDPASEMNFYRYFTKINDGPLLSPFSSVTDDQFFDGESFEFPLAKAESDPAEIDPATFGLYLRGDTVTIKWTTLDKEHFDFWNTVEFNAANQGPFSSYTRIDSNIEGGLGIWGGMAAKQYTIIVPEE